MAPIIRSSTAAAARVAIWSSCLALMAPLTPTAPITWPSITIGTPPISGVKSGWGGSPTIAVRPLLMTSSKKLVGFLNSAAVRALPTEMSAPAAKVPSRRSSATTWPPASTTAIAPPTLLRLASATAAAITRLAASSVRPFCSTTCALAPAAVSRSRNAPAMLVNLRIVRSFKWRGSPLRASPMTVRSGALAGAHRDSDHLANRRVGKDVAHRLHRRVLQLALAPAVGILARALIRADPWHLVDLGAGVVQYDLDDAVAHDRPAVAIEQLDLAPLGRVEAIIRLPEHGGEGQHVSGLRHDRQGIGAVEHHGRAHAVCRLHRRQQILRLPGLGLTLQAQARGRADREQRIGPAEHDRGARVALPSGSLSVSSVVSCSIVTVNAISPATAGIPIPSPAASANALISHRMLCAAPDIDLSFLEIHLPTRCRHWMTRSSAAQLVLIFLDHGFDASCVRHARP